MANEIFRSTNFVAIELRAGIVLRSLNSGTEVYFQPGDDAAIFRGTLEALSEVREDKRETVFDLICSNYL